MIIQVSPENGRHADPQVDSIEVTAEVREVPNSEKGQTAERNARSLALPASIPFRGLLKGLSWGLGALSLASAGLLLANRLKLRQELKKSTLQSMIGLNLEKFAGPWYEVAKFPHPGSVRKVGVMVNYEIVDPLTLRERYLYQEEDFDSETLEQSHLLHLVDPANPARMQKERRGPLAMNYWVLEVGEDYNYAVIGTPDRRHLWILSRTHQIPSDKFEALTHRLKKQGFAVEDLVMVPHHGITVGETAKPVINTEISSRNLPLEPRHAPHNN